MPPRIQERTRNKISIKRNDQVVVIAGKDKGKKGRVLRVLADRNRLLVEGVMMMKKHMKADPQRNIQGGIAEKEGTIHVSNVMLVDSDGKATRTGSRMDGETKVRFAKSNGAALPVRKR